MEKVITVGVQQQGQTAEELQASMDELEELVQTAGGTVVESHIQKRTRPDPATYVGKGKAQELAERLAAHKATSLICDDELRPSQQMNLTEVLEGKKVIDRTRLILDIFAQRARTREGILQVELAQMEYMLPRITEKFGTFEQQTGGIGSRGPGERKLEVDKRRIRDRITALKRDIEKVRSQREQQRSVRRSLPVPQVAIVGYTNAGKSTLLNMLLTKFAGAPKAESHKVYADDKLFATLDPITRRVRLPSGNVILFSDTVGFIRKLPTQLIASFRATLEEIGNADLVLHLIDGSDPARENHQKAVEEILKDLKLDTLARVTVFNKMDRLTPAQRDALSRQGDALISAGTGDGLKDLLSICERRLPTHDTRQ